MGRPREHDEARKAELLCVARRILAEQGPAELGLRGLVEQVDTTTRAVYSLFGSKESLVRALYITGFAELVDALHAVPRTEDPRADLLAACATYRGYAKREPTLYRLMCEQLVPEFEPTCADREHALPVLVDLASRLEACRDAGCLNPPTASPASLAPVAPRAPPLPVEPELDLATRQWWAVLHGLTALEIRGFLATPTDADSIWATTLTALLQPTEPDTGDPNRLAPTRPERDLTVADIAPAPFVTPRQGGDCPRG